jgi:serine/threonine protein kinase
MQFLSLVAFFTGDKTLEDLVKRYKKTMDDVYELTDSDINRASKLSPGQIPGFLENLRQEILRDSVRVNESNSTLATIYRRYGSLLNPPPDNPVGFMCREVVKLMGPSLRGWTLVKYLGGGAYGKVFLMKNPQGKSVAVKLQKIGAGSDDPSEEVRMQKIFAGHGLGPKVIQHTSTTTASGAMVDLIVMEPVDYTLREALCMAGNNRRRVQFVAEQIISLMERMKRHNLTHGDMHDENLAFRVEGGQLKPLLIDFGFSGENIHFPEVDAEQLARVMVTSDFGVPYPHTDILVEELETFLRLGGSRYKIKGTHNAHDDIHDEYMKKREQAKRKGARKKISHDFLSELYSDDDEDKYDEAFSYFHNTPKPKKKKNQSYPKKACRPDQYRNPVTGRCKKRSRSRSRPKKKVSRKRPTSRKLKSCKSHQYRHPVTHRCRNK